jgi:formylglycine-generating enzyme required for sulfatase activity
MFQLQFLIFLLLLSSQVLAQSKIEKIAVLQIKNEAKLKEDEIVFLSSQIQESVQALVLGRYQLMTQENISTLMPKDRSLEDCIQSQCVIEIGMTLGSALMINGQISKSQNQFQLDLQLYETQSKRQLSAQSLTVKDLFSLERQINGLVQGVLNEAFALIAPKAEEEQIIQDEMAYENMLQKIEEEAQKNKADYTTIERSLNHFIRFKKPNALDQYLKKNANNQFFSHFQHQFQQAQNQLIIQEKNQFLYAISIDWNAIRYRVKYKPDQAISLIYAFIDKYKDAQFENPFQEEVDQLLQYLKNQTPLPTYLDLIDWVEINHENPTQPQNQSFYVSKTEITVAQYTACVESKVCTPPHWDDLRCKVSLALNQFSTIAKLNHLFRADHLPVVCVDWHQARTFAQWIGGDLPTDTQWKDVLNTQELRSHYLRNMNCDHVVMGDALSFGCGQNQIWAPCSRTSLAKHGICDIVGNVWEWIIMDHQENDHQRIKGFGWKNTAISIQIINDIESRSASWGFDDVGFRVVKPLIDRIEVVKKTERVKANSKQIDTENYKKQVDVLINQALINQSKLAEIEQQWVHLQNQIYAGGAIEKINDFVHQYESFAPFSVIKQRINRFIENIEKRKKENQELQIEETWSSIKLELEILGKDGLVYIDDFIKKHPDYAQYHAQVKESLDQQSKSIHLIDWVKVDGRLYNGMPYLSSFYMSRSEVTVEQYDQCVKSGVCSPIKDYCYDIVHYKQKADQINLAPLHPVVCLSFKQARTFANWVGGDLPSEAQWKHAASSRGKYISLPWTNQDVSQVTHVDCEYANHKFSQCPNDQLQDICTSIKGHTLEGICDMNGNAYEWVLDDGAPHLIDLDVKHKALCTKTDCSAHSKTIKGGSFNTGVLPIQHQSHAEDARNDLGFRVVRPVYFELELKK